jgi:4'-phosphopantetheinyl transferase
MKSPHWHQVELFFGTAQDDPSHGAELLSAEELDRASRFHREQDRRCYIAAHALLRRALSRYCNINAAGIAFAQLEFGKPILATVNDAPPVHFSLSHSGAHAAVAICRSAEVGVDIEEQRTNFDPHDLARACMNARERDLISAAGDRSHACFLELWTAKEAVLKAAGFGLTVNPASLQLARSQTGQLSVEDVTDDRLSAGCWQITTVSTSAVTGAIATREGASSFLI